GRTWPRPSSTSTPWPSSWTRWAPRRASPNPISDRKRSSGGPAPERGFTAPAPRSGSARASSITWPARVRTRSALTPLGPRHHGAVAAAVGVVVVDVTADALGAAAGYAVDL